MLIYHIIVYTEGSFGSRQSARNCLLRFLGSSSAGFPSYSLLFSTYLFNGHGGLAYLLLPLLKEEQFFEFGQCVRHRV